MITDGNEKKVLTIVPSDSLGCKLSLECPSEDALVFFMYLFMVFYLSYDRTQRGILSGSGPSVGKGELLLALLLGICYAEEGMLAIGNTARSGNPSRERSFFTSSATFFCNFCF